MKRIKIKTLRKISLAALVGFVCIGLAFNTGSGTPSAWGLGLFNVVCPLGTLEAMLASKMLVPPAILGALLAILATIVVGKAFCSWGCPTPWLRSAVSGKKRACKDKPAGLGSANPLKDSRLWVLVGMLGSTALVGFPVFCLVCPVGLAFATLAAFWHLFQFNETGLALIVFPAMLLVELVVLRKWCSRICPIGALLSILSRANRTLRPSVDEDACLKSTLGAQACSHCTEKCPEGIDLHDPATLRDKHQECTKCGACADHCPAHAITFPFFAKRKERDASDAESARD